MLKGLSPFLTLLFILHFGIPSFSVGQTGSSGDPFTSLSQAWDVPSSDIYYFLIGGTSFSTYVESGSGWIMVASGDGSTEESSYSTTTSLTYRQDQILPTAIYTSSLATAVRITASSGFGIPFDIMTDDAGVLSNLQNDRTLSVGTASVTWTGTGTARVEGGCGSGDRALNRTIYHCGCNANGLHWIVDDGTGTEKVSVTESIPNDLELWIRADNATLPVKLSYFEAVSDPYEGVSLRWLTDSEINSDFFAVERSSDSRLWEDIGQVDAAGTSATPHTYLFSDQNPASGIAYYRLKQTDMSGGFVYSEVKEVTGPWATPIRVYPNPVTSTLSVSGGVSELSSLRIYNLMGQDMSHLISALPLNGTSLDLDLTRLPTGIYLLATPHSVQRVYKE